MELLPLKPISPNFTLRRSLLNDKTWSQSFLHKNLTMILSLFVRRWHASISREMISQPTLLKTSSTSDSKFSFETSHGMPATSKHFLFEYWAFAQHCLSISITLLLRTVLTFLTILISDSSLTKFSLNLRISSRASLFTLVYCSTLFWSDKVIPISSLPLQRAWLQIKVTVCWKVDSIYLH